MGEVVVPRAAYNPNQGSRLASMLIRQSLQLLVSRVLRLLAGTIGAPRFVHLRTPCLICFAIMRIIMYSPDPHATGIASATTATRTAIAAIAA
jgi:hypothetical protein